MRHGCQTAIASRNLKWVQNGAKKLEKATGGKCLALKTDVQSPASLQVILDEVMSKSCTADLTFSSMM